MFADRYELGSTLGKGGMAEVFEAVAHGAHGFSRRVAIKRLLPEVSGDPYLVRMFVDEARTASHLHNAGIVAVLDYGVVDGRPFQVLELVEGWNAAQLVRLGIERKKPMPVEVALTLVTELAHALAYAHERKDDTGRPLGIVHRDVKPSNLLVSASGDAKLGDFGIALARERSAVTTGFVVRGTPGYISPEQLLGAPVGPAADIFSAGLTLHALLTGASPLSVQNHHLLLGGGEVPISPDLPLDAREIIVRALRVTPEERYPSARAMAHALGEVLMPRLSTDPTTRVAQWIEELDAKPPVSNPTTTAILVPTAEQGRFATMTVTPPVNPAERPREINAPPTIVQTAPPPQELASPPTRRAETSSRAIFIAAATTPLLLGALALTSFAVARRSSPPGEPAKPDAKASAVLEPPAFPSAAPSAAPSLAITEPPAPTTPALKVAPVPSGKPLPELEHMVVSVSITPSSRASLEDPFVATAAELDRVAANMEAVVRKCLVGRRVTRGAVVELQIGFSRETGITYREAYSICRGQYCAKGQTEWVPRDAVTCVTNGSNVLTFPPLASTYTNYYTRTDFVFR